MDTDKMPQIIGLYSPVPQSGKTTLAEFLTTLGYTRMGHAEPIKSMAETLLFSYVGLGLGEIKATRGPTKDTTLPDIKCSRRQIERAIGFGLREQINPNIWSDVLIGRAEDHQGPVVIDDVRFPNEFAAIRQAGGQLWRIERSGSPCWHMAEYESESLLEDHDFDHQLVNEGTPDALFTQAADIIGPLV